MISWPSSLDDYAVHCMREIAVRHLEYACGWDKGRSELDPVYLRVTEGRDHGAMRTRYSSCGDLPHWLLWQMGVRLPWVNRDSNGGWRVGRNIELLHARGSGNLGNPPAPGEFFEPGDIGLLWSDHNPNNAHAFCVIDQPNDSLLLTAEYGQPGGALRERRIVDGCIGARRIQWRLPFDLVIYAAAARGMLVAAEEPILHG